MQRVIGIDLGTTNSCIAVLENGQPKVLINKEGQRTTPSIVAYTDDGSIIVGDAAKRQFVTNPKNTVASVKRYIGSKYNEIKTKINSSYDVSHKGDNPVVLINGKMLSPQEISAKVLIDLKKIAEEYYGEEVKDAVITCPAYFNDSQRKATKEAGQIAGLNVLRVINEPTAAALAYGVDSNKNSKIVVADIGGGTSDFTILDINDGTFKVLSTTGDTFLGGDNFNDAIYDYIMSEICIRLGFTPLELTQFQINSPSNKARIKEVAEKAKIDLSSTEKTKIMLPFLGYDIKKNAPINFECELTRAKFDDITKGLIDDIKKLCRDAVINAKIKTEDIDEIIMVGGSTRIPAIRDAVKAFFDKPVNTSVNPDEVVALGAAIQAGILNGDVDDLALLDVTPLTLGIETLGGEMTPIIHANTTIPVTITDIFSTSNDNQKSVEVHVLQGERIMAMDNKSLGKFKLEGIPPMPRATPQIEVSFNIDSDGILSVSAKELTTNLNQTITIQAGSGLTSAEIDEMRNNAIEYKKMDDLRSDIIQAKNNLEAKIYEARQEVSLIPNKDKSSWSQRTRELLAKPIETSFDYLNIINDLIKEYSQLYKKSEV